MAFGCSISRPVYPVIRYMLSASERSPIIADLRAGLGTLSEETAEPISCPLFSQKLYSDASHGASATISNLTTSCFLFDIIASLE